MSQQRMTLEAILEALFKKAAHGDAEVEELKSQPRFRRVIEALLQEGRRSDELKMEAEQASKSALSTLKPAVTELPSPQATSSTQGSAPASLPLSVFHYPGHRAHFSKEYPMESPQRVEAILSILRRQRFFEQPRCSLVEAVPAKPEDILRVHDTAYVEFIRSHCSQGGGLLPRNTYVATGSWEAALGAVGCTLGAGEAVKGSGGFAFALTRPAGHHAGVDSYGGFCLFNNAAILARSLEEQASVMVLNWDVHASNGTKHIFYVDPAVLTVSLHRDPTDFFPREGWVHEIGSGAGEGYTVNIPLPPGSGDEDYLLAFDSIVRPLHRQFKPDYIIVECGFDAHWKDPLGGQRVTNNGYYELGKRLVSLPGKGVILTLEGGYNARTIGETACSLISAILGKANPFPEEPPQMPVGKTDSLSYSLMSKSGKSRTEPPGKLISVVAVIEQLRNRLQGYWKL